MNFKAISQRKYLPHVHPCFWEQASTFRQESWLDLPPWRYYRQPLSSDFDEVTLTHHGFILVPTLGRYHSIRVCGLIYEMSWRLGARGVASLVKQGAQGVSLFRSSPNLIFPLGFPSWGCQWTPTERLWKHTQDREAEKGHRVFPWLLSLAFPYVAVLSQIR